MGWLYGYDSHPALVRHLREQLGGLIAQQETFDTTPAGQVLTALRPAARGVVKDAQMGYGRRYYAAFAPGDGSVTIIVILLNHGLDRNEPGTDAWGYKDMSESCGPVEHDCPLSILNLATDPAPNAYAVAWRAKVRDYWSTRLTSQRLARSAKRGDLVYVRNYSKNPYRVTHIKPLEGVNASDELYRIPSTRIERIEAV